MKAIGKLLFGDDKVGLLSDNGRIEWLILDVSGWYVTCDEMFVYYSKLEEGKLFAVDINTLSPIWNYELPTVTSGYDSRDLFGVVKYSILFQQNKLSLYGLGIDYYWIFNGTNNIYIPLNVIFAISKETGELRWRGLVSNIGFKDSTKDVNNWLGEVNDMVVYSHIGFGWTQTYDVINHRFLWENPHVVLKEFLGITEDTLIGLLYQPRSSWDEPPTIIVGLEQKTGKELWRSELAEIQDVRLIQGRLFYLLKGKSGVWFIDPRSGELLTMVAIEKSKYTNYFMLIDRMIVVYGDKKLAVINP